MLKRTYLRRFFAAVLTCVLLVGVRCLPALVASSRAGEIVPPALAPLALRPAERSAAEPVPLLDLNRATEDELAALPGIGAVLAGRIVEYRARCGDFADTEELMCVEGIGPGIYEKVKEYLTVS